MFGSQALETAIGLAVLLFIFATAASSITEVFAAVTKKRAKDLEHALKDMFNAGTLPSGVEKMAKSEVQKFIEMATGRGTSSYLSPKAFADAATEMVSKGHYLGGVADRLESLSRQAKGGLETAKAGLETWFDQTMMTVQDTYSRWASLCLLLIGFVLAVVMNASAINVGYDLWRDSAARQAVVVAANSTETLSLVCKDGNGALQQAQCDFAEIPTFQLPLGWGDAQRKGWNEGGRESIAWWLSHIFGWLLTGLLVMLGGPFWFDVLNKLVNLRAGGPRPQAASDDEASYSRRVIANPPSPPPINQWVPSGAVGDQLLTGEDEADMDMETSQNRLESYRSAIPSATQAENVDWLATALNLGMPMKMVRTTLEGDRTPEQGERSGDGAADTPTSASPGSS